MRCSDALRVMRVRMEVKYQQEHSSGAVLLRLTNLMHELRGSRMQAVLISWDLFFLQ